MKKLILFLYFLLPPILAFADDSGQTGDCTWYFEEASGTLTISGNGAMADYSYEENYYEQSQFEERYVSCDDFNYYEKYPSFENPWSAYWGQISKVVITDGVTHIGDYAFFEESNGVTSVTIPESVTSIGYGAFSGCKITSIDIPSSVSEIGQNAFEFTSLTSIVIPDGIQAIGHNMFNGCSNLVSVTLPESITSIGMCAFYNCTSLESVNIPSNVTSIKKGAFANCSSLTSIEIPSGVTLFGPGVFYGCGFEEVIIPESMNSIPRGFFAGCKRLKNITIPEGVTQIKARAFEECSGLESVVLPISLNYLGNGAFLNCTELQSVTIPPSVFMETDDENKEYYGDDPENPVSVPFPFEGCGKLTELIVPEGITIITANEGNDYNYYPYENWFYPNIQRIILPDGLTKIGDFGLYGFSELTEVNIPETVTEIGACAFEGSVKLSDLSIPNTITTIGGGAFGSSGLKTISLPDNLTTIEDGLFNNCEQLTSITIPNSVNSIGESAFQNCSALETITMSANVTSIGDFAFDGCDNVSKVKLHISDFAEFCGKSHDFASYGLNTPLTLYVDGEEITDLVIPNDVETIAEKAFYNCKGLTSLTMSENITSIGAYAFEECVGLESVVLPKSLKFMGRGAFHNCVNMKSITVPPAVYMETDDKSFYDENGYYNDDLQCFPFEGCSSLVELRVPEGITKIDGMDGQLYPYEGGHYPNVQRIIIPDGVTTIGECGIYGFFELTEVNIPETVTELGDYAFCECLKLPELTIPSGVTSIGVGALAWTSIKTIELPDGLTSISDRLFEGCEQLTSITIPNSVTSIGENVFDKCAALETITMSTNVTSIAPSAFQGCENVSQVNLSVTNLSDFCVIGHDYASYGLNSPLTLYVDGEEITELVIPNNVENIAEKAFYNCKGLTSLTMSESISNIGENAFAGCDNLNLVKMDVSDLAVFCGKSHDYSNIGLSSSLSLYVGGEEVTDLVIPSTVTTISCSAFQNCTALTSLKLSDSVTEIGENAFLGCENISELKIDVTDVSAFCGKSHNYTSAGLSIPAKLYSDGEEIAELMIPSDVEAIVTDAFYNCPDLTSVFMTNGIDNIGEKAFNGCENISELKIDVTDMAIFCGKSHNYSAGGLCVPTKLYSDGEEITELVIPDGVETIVTDAFYNCPDLSFLSLPNGITSVGQNAFRSCGNISELRIDVTDIAEFSGKNHDYSGIGIVLPLSLYQEGEPISDLVIPDNVGAIASSAFNNCPTLTSVTIPASVTSIGENAFYNCSNLTSVSVNNPTPVSITSGTFSNRANAILFIPDGSKPAYQSASYWNEFGGLQYGRDWGNVLEIADTKIEHGANGTMSISLKNQDQVTAVQFKLVLPADVKLLEYDLTDRKVDHTIQYGDGQVMIISLTSSPFSGSEGELVTLKLGTETEGIYNIELKEIELSTTNGIGIKPLDRSATFTICDIPLGDTNGDGVITISDAVAIVNYKLGRASNSFVKGAADVNADGEISITDAVIIVNWILNENIGEVAPVKSRINKEDILDPQ